MSDLRSPLSKAKGLGASGHASHHWWMQRLSAIALVPLVVWFMINVVRAADAPNGIMHFLYSPFHALAMALFIGTMLYHGALGMKVIYEDYISCLCARTFMIIATNFASIALGAGAILAIIYVHVTGAASYQTYKEDIKSHQEIMHKGI